MTTPSLIETPTHVHDCDACVFLGGYVTAAHARIDLYWHSSLPRSLSSVIGRYGSDGPDYASSHPPEAFADAMYESIEEPWYRAAMNAARARGLYQPDHGALLAQIARYGGARTWATLVRIAPELEGRLRAAYAGATLDEQRAAWWHFRPAIMLAPEPPIAAAAEFVLGDFTHGDEDPLAVRGYDQGQSWNGWACPLIDDAEVERLIQKWPPGDRMTLRWGRNKHDCGPRALVLAEDGDESEILAVHVEHEPDDQGRTSGWYYQVGATLGLCWTVREPAVRP